ncbi:MAG: cytochrome c oxidase accessory protein FixG [Candidatus Endobugula sp.]|jgi:cytochrome c oxidase accessory protein FixG
MSDSHDRLPSSSDESTIRYVNLYESEDKIYLRKISGFYQSLRRYTGLPLMLGFLLLPWLVIDARPAILFDLPARQFHILWVTFGPQDGILLAWLLIISAFALFTVTAFFGRVWCGFTCPQTVWTLMFIWAEHVCEGDRNKRIKLDKSEWDLEKTTRKTAKFSLWFIISFITGLTFVGYFYPVRDLLAGFVPYFDESGFLVFDSFTAIFWTLFFTAMTYMNAGFLREQVCKYMCPYARFQSVMYDNDTLAVHYDAARGENRGARKPEDDYTTTALGDCVDCSWCVQVCPVDIDIRDGLQYECINCGLCVDACNTVMDKMDYSRGLIRFTSEDELATGKTQFVRFRVFAYIGVLAIVMGLFVFTVANRQPVSVDVKRDRGSQMFQVRQGNVHNIYRVKINNMQRGEQTYTISLDAGLPFTIVKNRPVLLEEGEIYSVPIRVSIAEDRLTEISTDITFIVTDVNNPAIKTQEKTRFIGPQQ